MISKFLSLAAVVCAQELGTDCNAVRRFLFPDAPECSNQQSCSDDYACVVTANCDNYTCVAGRECPDGTTYQVLSSNVDQNTLRAFRAGSLGGYYCSETPPLCGFNEDGHFYIETTVKNKYPWDGIGTPDNRQLSLISKTTFDDNVGEIFKQFGKSNCTGETYDNGERVRFMNFANDPNCQNEIKIDYVESESNGLTYVIDFYIGFDDLWITDPITGRELIERGGVANQFECRIVASGIDAEMPFGNRVTVTDLIEYEGKIELDLETYLDDEFSQVGNYANLTERPDFNYFYIEGKHDLEADNALQSHVFHFKKCRAQKFQIEAESGVEVEIENTVFITDGCIKDGTLPVNTYYQKDTRSEWTDETTPTYSKDQFMIVPRYDPNIPTKIKYTCDMVLCPLDALFTETSKIAPCVVDAECKTDALNRYENLRRSRNRRSGSEENSMFKFITKTVDFEISGITSGDLQQAVASVALICLLAVF